MAIYTFSLMSNSKLERNGRIAAIERMVAFKHSTNSEEHRERKTE